MLLAEDQVVLLQRIVLHIVQFIDVPDAVILNELVSLRSQGKRSWCLGIVVFPVVLVQDVLAPLVGRHFSCRQFQEAFPIHLLRRRDAGGL